MNIGITAVIYNGYGKFLNKFLESIHRLEIPPAMVTIVLGKNHGVPSGILWPPKVNVVYAEEEDNLGRLKNFGVLHTPTEWIMGMSIDDEVLPWAFEEFQKHSQNADIIVSKYLFMAEKSICMHPKINKEILLSEAYYIKGGNYMHGSTPFRRTLWEKHNYKESDCFNTLFWIDCAGDNARFAHTDIPCLIYNKWEGSHSHVSFIERNKRFKIINDYRIKKVNEIFNI
jgi:hypothetical protein